MEWSFGLFFMAVVIFVTTLMFGTIWISIFLFTKKEKFQNSRISINNGNCNYYTIFTFGKFCF